MPSFLFYTRDAFVGDGGAMSPAPSKDGIASDFEVTMIAGSGHDRLTGHALNSALTGRAGHDTLSGLGGDDRIDGGLGHDLIDGGTGFDTLVLTQKVSYRIDLARSGSQDTGEGVDTLRRIEAVKDRAGGIMTGSREQAG